MIYKLESINVVISKIVRDLGLGNQDIPYQDFVEWVADALLQIGAYAQFKEMEAVVDITDYSGILPCDLYKLVRLQVGCKQDDSCCDKTFYDCTYQEIVEKSGGDFSSLNIYDQNLILNPAKPRMMAGASSQRPQSLKYNKHLFGDVKSNSITDLDYNIQANKINMGFETGKITVQYIGIPTDEQGYPLVPDDVGFREAMFWNIAYHISMRNPDMLPNQRMRDMEYCRQMWEKYCGQARSYANMPDVHQIENLKNILWRQVRDVSASLTDYTDIGLAQNLDLDGRR